jgi:predicted dehydrogenase
MDREKLVIGVLGLDRRAVCVLECLSKLDVFDLHAVAGGDTAHAEQIAAKYQCRSFDDYRQFILQSPLDWLVIGAPLHRCIDYVRMALKKGMHILKLPPMARTFEEAVELAALARQNKVRLCVANPGRYSQHFIRLRERLTQEHADHPFMVRVYCDIGLLKGEDSQRLPLDPDHEKVWITDQSLAGGGVLLHSAYGLVDQLVAVLNMPQQVYALCSSTASAKQQLHHLAEDRTLVSLRFDEGLMADMVALRYWDDREPHERITVYCTGKTYIMTPALLRVCDIHGRELEHMTFDDSVHISLTRLLEALAHNHIHPQEHPFLCDCEVNLKNMAVIEAAYMSARTGVPEEPARIYDRAVS